MNAIKRILGIIWILLALVCAYYCILDKNLGSLHKFTTHKQEDLVYGIVLLCVLTPIIVGGLLIFGYYSLTGEYDDSKA